MKEGNKENRNMERKEGAAQVSLLDTSAQEANEPLITCTKGIKDDSIHQTKIMDSSDIKKIMEIINTKLPQPKETKLGDINLRRNPKMWVRELLDDYPQSDRKTFEELLSDFTDSMQTRMREDSKYVVGILFKKELLIAHTSYGEKTITPEWKTIPRMLDGDNILRYVHFIDQDGTIIVRYFEKWATLSFVDWLRLPEKEAFYYFGGKYRISSSINGFSISLELTEEDVETLINSGSIIHDDVISFDPPVSRLKISQIIAGRKKYEHFGDFIQDYEAEKYDIEWYREEYMKIIQSLGPLTEKHIDEKNRVIKISSGREVTLLNKRNNNLDILFVTNKYGGIELRDSYLDNLYNRFLTGEKINIYHVEKPFLANSNLKIGSMTIYNQCQFLELSKNLIKYYNNTNLQDVILHRILEMIIFNILARENEESGLGYFFDIFSKKIESEINSFNQLTKTEDGTLEFKDRDFFVGNDEEIIKRLFEDIEKKLKASTNKVYLIGVEDGGKVTPISKSKLKSDRVESIRKRLEEKTRRKVIMFPILWDGEGIIILIIGDLK